MKIILIRHGKTQYNKEKRYTGRSDVPLSAEGISELVINSFNIENLDSYKLYTSSLTRTKETASILLKNKLINASFTAFDEMHLGDFEGHTYDELKDNKHYQEWLNDIYVNRTLNGETFLEFKDRVLMKFNELCYQEEDFILVSHGGTMKLIMSEIINKRIPFFEWDVQNGKGFIIEINKTITYEEII